MRSPDKNITGLHPVCIASTDDQYNRVSRSNDGLIHRHGSNLFKDVQFTGDGSTVITLNEDQRLRTFVLPSDILEDPLQPHILESYDECQSATNVQSYAVYPFFDIQDVTSTVVLYSSAHVPISLKNALHYGTICGTYPWIKAATEDFLSARSLAFTLDGMRFIAGGDNALALFDIHQDGSAPIVTHTLKRSRKSRQYGVGTTELQGTATALSVGADGTLAVGTQLREVALFDLEGSGSCSTAFSLASSSRQSTLRGSGVMHLRWSPCGRYLLVAERQTDCVHVYDIRNTLTRVSILTGRQSNTTQKIGIDVVSIASGYEVWGGSTSGRVNMWTNPGFAEGNCAPEDTFPMHRAPVSGVAWHSEGSVLATCSGERTWPGSVDETDGSPRADNSLKIWSIQRTAT